MGCLNQQAAQEPSKFNNVNNQQNGDGPKTTKTLDSKGQSFPDENAPNSGISQSLGGSNIRRTIKPKKGPEGGESLDEFTSRVFSEKDKEGKGYLNLA